MILVERHIIKKGHAFYQECDHLCFLSKNLYNKANYIIRQEFIETTKDKKEGKREKANWIRYGEIQKRLQDENDPDYRALPSNVSQQVLRIIDKDWLSFFNYVHKYKDSNVFISLPRYKHKKNGRNLLVFTLSSILMSELRNNGDIHLSNTSIIFSTKQKLIRQVRVIPRLGYYVIEVLYRKEIQHVKLNQNRIAGIDLGINNLATVTSNVRSVAPIIVNGRPLKSLNHYFNKKKAELQSFVGTGSSVRLKKLFFKRDMIIHNYLHQASRKIVDHLIKNEIGTVVIGKNIGWKDKINIGKRNNQNFVCIPPR